MQWPAENKLIALKYGSITQLPLDVLEKIDALVGCKPGQIFRVMFHWQQHTFAHDGNKIDVLLSLKVCAPELARTYPSLMSELVSFVNTHNSTPLQIKETLEILLPYEKASCVYIRYATPRHDGDKKFTIEFTGSRSSSSLPFLLPTQEERNMTEERIVKFVESYVKRQGLALVIDARKSEISRFREIQKLPEDNKIPIYNIKGDMATTFFKEYDHENNIADVFGFKSIDSWDFNPDGPNHYTAQNIFNNGDIKLPVILKVQTNEAPRYFDAEEDSFGPMSFSFGHHKGQMFDEYGVKYRVFDEDDLFVNRLTVPSSWSLCRPIVAQTVTLSRPVHIAAPRKR